MVFRRSRQVSGSRKAIVYAVLVHALLAALLVAGIRRQAPPQPPAPVIQARVVNEADVRNEQEQRRRAEQERAAAARQQREQEEQRRQEQARAAEQKRRAEAEKQRKVQEKRAAEARAKKETEDRRRAAEAGLKEQLAREEKERATAAQAEQSARARSELARYEGLIRQKIDRNWVRQPDWKNMEVVVRVRLAPTGEVIEATIARPSGNAGFDRSVENAVYKASPLPLPEDKGLFEHFRELELRFRPEGQG